MHKYGQYCPVARAVEILGDRWTLLIVRDLLCGVHHFNQLERGLPGISRSLLAERLRRLQRAGLLERRVDRDGHATSYHLTQAGRELQPIIDGLLHWGARWAFGPPEPQELDPVLLLWWMRDRIARQQLPQQRVVVELTFYGPRRGTYWLVLRPDDVSICLQHPGFEIDVLVTAQLAVFYQVWLGRMAFADALYEGSIQLDGPPALTRAFPGWLMRSAAAEAVQAVAT
jgi:DNA-binding HxlR family transcriptional regulator